MPIEFIQFYANQAPFYEKIKMVRDRIIHRPIENKGTQFFVFDDGFGISSNEYLKEDLFEQFNVWEKKDCKSNGGYSIRPLLNHIISNTLNTCDEFFEYVIKHVVLEEPIIKDYYVFFRHPHIKNYINMNKELEHSSWWNMGGKQ